jgi:hypothetical protein
MVRKIVSGGQTGADRAALDFAIEHAIAHGGWAPRGRRAEGGPIPGRYCLSEMATASYPKRTERNVVDSDGTVIITHGIPRGGSALTIRLANAHGRPCLHLDMNRTGADEAAERLAAWLEEYDISLLNIAGPRASEDRSIYDVTKQVLEKTLIQGQRSDRSRHPFPES